MSDSFFFNLVFLLLQKLTILCLGTCKCNVNKLLFPGNSFLRIIDVVTFRMDKYFSFHLTRKPYPRFCLSTMGALLTAPAVAHTQWLRHSIVVGHTFNKE